MKRILTIVLFVVFLVLLWQLHQLYKQNQELRDAFSLIEEKVNAFKAENLQFQADIEYFSNPQNLEKELRSRYNYKKPGEKLIILVPSQPERQ